MRGWKRRSAECSAAAWQRCRVHWMRNALAHVSKTEQSMVAAVLRQGFLQPHSGPGQRNVALCRRPIAPEMAEARHG
jgi:putative transposase